MASSWPSTGTGQGILMSFLMVVRSADASSEGICREKQHGKSVGASAHTLRDVIRLNRLPSSALRRFPANQPQRRAASCARRSAAVQPPAISFSGDARTDACLIALAATTT
eukprot:scaffold442_cov268-Pinguiococcus_pyrenoidosus.AAC.103